jgi:hypothetical protein
MSAFSWSGELPDELQVAGAYGMRHRNSCICLSAATLLLGTPVSGLAAGKLAGRPIIFKKTFDGWWDVACDAAPDGSDPCCYMQLLPSKSGPL